MDIIQHRYNIQIKLQHTWEMKITIGSEILHKTYKQTDFKGHHKYRFLEI